MKATKRRIKSCARTFSVGIGALVWMLGFATSATAQPYADSAHGNASYGVNRSDTGYDIGSCAHCHDVFDPDICGNNTYGLMLFASNDSPGSQTDNFCFQCHKGSGSVQVGGITNDTYSKNFGGGTATFTTVYDAFNPTTGDTPSSHNLADVLNHAVNNIGFGSDTNACIVCHDQHVAQQNYPVTLSGLGGVKTAIRRPADYPSPGVPSNLWGDEDATSGFNERMKDYTNKYQAPYYVGGTTYEPANDSTVDGSNVPNMKNFCSSQCHGTNNVYSTERGRYLRKIDWANEQHGKLHNGGMIGASIAPYTDHGFNYVLSCTDCHEPHGSENEWLLRTTINGTDGLSVTGDGEWSQICGACHTWNLHAVSVTTCWGDGVWNCHHHGAGGGMF